MKLLAFPFRWTAFCIAITCASALRAMYSCGNPVSQNSLLLEPITSVVLVSGESKNVSCPMYYEKIDFDLNYGAKGKYIFACIIRGQNNYGIPLSSIMFTASKTSKNICPLNTTRLSQDLNEGSGGDYVYLCLNRFESQGITDLVFIDSSKEICPTGYETSAIDLNSGVDSAPQVNACIQSNCNLLIKYSPELKFRNDDSFKIVQFTDSHYGESYQFDLLTATNIYRQVLVTEDPDVVALTGDAVSGYAWDGTEGWFAEVYHRVIDTMLSLGYPYFYLNGNHDPQADLTQREVVQTDITLGHYMSMTQLGPENITGASNYYIPILSSTGNELAYSLWVLGSSYHS